MNNLIKLLNSHAELYAWRINVLDQKSKELFYVPSGLETVRSTDTRDVNVTVYSRHDGKMGDSSFAVYHYMTDEEIVSAIDKAVFRANLINNEIYELPKEDSFIGELPTNISVDSMELGQSIAETVFSVIKETRESINALEIFINEKVDRVINSNGLDKKQTTHGVMIEAIPTYTTSEYSVEIYEDCRFSIFDEEKLAKEIRDRLSEVKERFYAKKEDIPSMMPCLLSRDAVSMLFNEISAQLSYRNVYSKHNLYHIGDSIQTGSSCDKITMNVCGSLEGYPESEFFDSDGVSIKDTQIVSEGTIRSYFGSTRFAQYLNQPDTGMAKCLSVLPGSLSEEELASMDYLECVSMSSPQIDPYSDYIGGEVRLARWHHQGKVIPVSGISFSASFQDALNSLRLGNHLELIENCSCPDKVLLKQVTVI